MLLQCDLEQALVIHLSTQKIRFSVEKQSVRILTLTIKDNGTKSLKVLVKL